MSRSPGQASWYVYLVRCRDGSLYTGITTDVVRRLAQHERGAGNGAKYLRGKGPLQLVFKKAIGRRGMALRVERRIKRLAKARKEALIERAVQCIHGTGRQPRPPRAD